MYKDDSGKLKGDGTVTYEDPAAANSAPDFFDGAIRRASSFSLHRGVGDDHSVRCDDDDCH
jgi:hypothetical protein